MNTVVSLLPLLSLGYLVASLTWLAPRKPGYSHLLHTISELGEIGSPDQRIVAWRVFLPVGLAFLPVSLLFHDSAPLVSALALCVAVGYLVAVLFPCDPGSPASGSARQGMHNLGGAVEYIGGGLSLLIAADDYGVYARIAGFMVLGVAVGLTVLPAWAMRGMLQRVGESVLFISVAWLAWSHANES